MADNDQMEHSNISTALEVEQIEVNLFRSKQIEHWLPPRARGVFGGQVISQAIVSATNCVDPGFGLHSLHCYFILSASPAVSILYFVERLREGKSYCTRSVKAVQNGHIILHLLCSFHRGELWQPSYQWPMPQDVPKLEDCELEETLIRRLASRPGVPEKVKQNYFAWVDARSKGPIAIRHAKREESEDGILKLMFWLQARDIPKYEAPFQKCILAYLSDLNFLGVASQTLKLKRDSTGQDAHSMISTLDHSIFYYDDNFDCGDGLLYVIECPRAASGRGVVQGRLYTRSGSLVAVATQEGVIRANRGGPEDTKAKL